MARRFELATEGTSKAEAGRGAAEPERTEMNESKQQHAQTRVRQHRVCTPPRVSIPAAQSQFTPVPAILYPAAPLKPRMPPLSATRLADAIAITRPLLSVACGYNGRPIRNLPTLPSSMNLSSLAHNSADTNTCFPTTHQYPRHPLRLWSLLLRHRPIIEMGGHTVELNPEIVNQYPSLTRCEAPHVHVTLFLIRAVAMAMISHPRRRRLISNLIR